MPQPVWRVRTTFGVTIERFTAESTTDRTVVIAGSRYSRVSQGQRFFTDFNEAYRFASETIEQNIQAANREIDRMADCRHTINRQLDQHNQEQPTT
jgi:hypothetical protein